MAVGHSDDIDPEAAVDAVVAQCHRALAGERPRAGLLFLTYDIDPVPLMAGVRKAYPDTELVGTTATGEISSVLGFQEDSVTLAVFASDTVDITAGLANGVLSSDPAVPRSGRSKRHEQRRARNPVCASPSRPSPAQGADGAPAGAPARAGRGRPGHRRRVGAAGPGDPLQARQFPTGEIHEDAAAVLLFSGPLSFSFGVDTGWRPIGPRGTVTETSGNILRGIDDEPALAFYRRYLGTGEGSPTPANPLAVFEDDWERLLPPRAVARRRGREPSGDRRRCRRLVGPAHRRRRPTRSSPEPGRRLRSGRGAAPRADDRPDGRPRVLVRGPEAGARHPNGAGARHRQERAGRRTAVGGCTATARSPRPVGRPPASTTRPSWRSCSASPA